MSDKDFKVKNKLQVKGITSAGPVVSDASGNLDSTAYVATQYGGTGTSTSPSSGQILYSSSGTTYAPTTLTSLDVKGASYSADAPSSPVVGQIWVESDSSSDSFDPNIIRRQAFTATAGQTVFTTSQTFIDGYEQVFFNGLLLLRTTDYTTSNSNTVTLASGSAVNDIVEVVTVTNLNSTNTYTQSEINASLATKLSTSTAASTYLTQSNAATTYVPQSNYFVAGKNAVINGGFDIAQRGTSFTGLSGSDYTLDRWVAWAQTGGQSSYVSQQSVGNLSVTPNQAIRYCGRFGRTSGTTNVGTRSLFQTLETSDSIRFAGQNVTMSFYARAGANFSATGNLVDVNIVSGTGTDQIYYSFTGFTNVVATNVTLTTSWQRFSVTGLVATSATQMAVRFGFTPTGTAGAADYIEITGVQLETGSSATPFSRASGNIQSELAACQRYYLRYGGNQAYETFPGVLISYSTTQGEGPIALKSTMRTTPTVTFSTLKISDVATYNIAVSNLAITTGNSGPDAAYLVFTVAGGVTAGKTNLLRTDASTSGYLAFSAEL